MTIGNRVKTRREELGMSQTVLAKRIGVSGPSLSQLESGKIKRSRRMDKLASVLKVTPAWLEGGEGKPAAGAGSPARTNGAAKSNGAAKADGAARPNGAAKPNGAVKVEAVAKANGVARQAANGKPVAHAKAVPAKVMRLAESLVPLPANKLKALFVLAGIR